MEKFRTATGKNGTVRSRREFVLARRSIALIACRGRIFPRDSEKSRTLTVENGSASENTATGLLTDARDNDKITKAG